MSNTRCHHCGRGTTIVEVIVAIVIFSVFMLAGLNFFFFARKFSSDARQWIYAVNFGKAQMNSYQTMRFDDPAIAMNNSINPYIKTATGPDGTIYTFTASVTDLSMNNTIYKDIAATVTWPGHPAFSPMSSPGAFTVDYEMWITTPVVK